MKLDEFEAMMRSAGSVVGPTREAHQFKLARGEHNVRRDLRQMAARRRFIYNAAIDPPDQATWNRALERRVEELGGEVLTLARQLGPRSPVDVEIILREAEADELEERQVFEDGVAFVLNLLRHYFPEGTSMETKQEFIEVQTAQLEASNLTLFDFK